MKKKTEKSGNNVDLMELQVLANLFVMLKNSTAQLTTVDKVEALINKTLDRVQ